MNPRERVESDIFVDKYRQSIGKSSEVSLSKRALHSLQRTQGKTHAGIVVPNFQQLTNALFGFRGVTLLTAPYGIGKTTFTLNIALEVARGGSCKVVYITSEMSAVRLVTRLLTDMAKPKDKGGGHALTMQRILVGDSNISSIERKKAEELGLPHLGTLQLEQFQEAVKEFQSLEGDSLHIVDMNDIGSMEWSRSKGEHALTPLERKVDELTGKVNEYTGRGAEVLVILDTIAHLEIQPNSVGGGLVDYKDDLSQDRDITAGLRAWRDYLGDNRALLAVHEESKARSGSGDGHSVRGSSRYAYGADALIQMTYADSDRNTDGTVSLGLRDHNPSDEIAQVDAIINKARDGGTAGVTIPLDHHWHEARMYEVGTCFTKKDIIDARRERKK